MRAIMRRQDEIEVAACHPLADGPKTLVEGHCNKRPDPADRTESVSSPRARQYHARALPVAAKRITPDL
jgi:hypothetical protein